MPYPILYSLRHCPYAMRARMALLLAKQAVILRAIVMDNKPEEMLAVSAKGTVPVLVFNQSTIIDESIEIMLWALHKNDPNNLLYSAQADTYKQMLSLINYNDNEFKTHLEEYKQAKRYHKTTIIHSRQQCEIFIQQLEQRLTRHDFFMGTTASLADYAIFPFIRQFAKVERSWYIQAPYPRLQQWLIAQLQDPLFSKAMIQYPLWLDKHETIIFAGE
ncbi:MAG: glutathione S-transferase [Pseudomonadota bacterium]